MRAGKVPVFVFIRYITGKDDILPPLSFDILLKTAPQPALSDKKKTGIGIPFPNVGDGTQQIFCTLTLLETSHKENIPLSIHIFWERCNIGTEVIQIDTIWNYTIVSWKVARDELASGSRNGDATR